jgi:uncharacterized membrane protein
MSKMSALHVFVGGEPPHPDAGDMAEQTKVLRPQMGLTEFQCAKARRLRRKGYDIAAIAQLLEADDDSVRQALAAMRTPTPNPSRKTLNVTVAAQAFVVAEALPDEPYWQTVDRLFAELTFRRSN